MRDKDERKEHVVNIPAPHSYLGPHIHLVAGPRILVADAAVDARIRTLPAVEGSPVAGIHLVDAVVGLAHSLAVEGTAADRTAAHAEAAGSHLEAVGCCSLGTGLVGWDSCHHRRRRRSNYGKTCGGVGCKEILDEV